MLLVDEQAGASVGMFASLSNRNFRLYLLGQLVTQAGSFMQAVAQSWLVLQMTDSGSALGFLIVLQYGPLLLLGGPAGVLADRIDRRKLYLAVQVLAGLEAVVLGALVISGGIELWMVYVLATVLGLLTALEHPVRITIVSDLVPLHLLTGAISLNMTMFNLGRMIGPALAGVAIATIGVGPCFLLNAASYGLVSIILLMMRSSEMTPQPLQGREPGQVRRGFTYVRDDPALRSMLVMGTIIFGLAWQFDIVLPLLARDTFGGGASLYGVLNSAVGLGAALGGIYAARRAAPTMALLYRSLAAAGGFLALTALAPVPAVAVAGLLAAALTGVVFASCCSARLQLLSEPAMRGRVMALWATGSIGARPLSAPILGFVGDHLGARTAILSESAAILLVALPLGAYLARERPLSAVAGESVTVDLA